MDYRLELLSDDDFEKLVNMICQDILGMGMISFAKGKDGGRDGKFNGVANCYPSNSEQWKGNFIIQAKHTASPIANCSDSEFKQIIAKETKKIKDLKEKGDVDCYLLFTNRKYSAVVGESILTTLKNDTGLENIAIIGKETINDLYLQNNSKIVKTFGLNLLHIPFDFSELEIRNIILEFHEDLKIKKEELKDKVDELRFDFNRIKIEEKNLKNNLSKKYYEEEILSHSLQDFQKIEMFLSDPRNEELKEQYFDIASELRNIIQVKRDDFTLFEQIFVFIFKKICDGNDIRGKRHVYTLLHFMYYECLIGIK